MEIFNRQRHALFATMFEVDRNWFDLVVVGIEILHTGNSSTCYNNSSSSKRLIIIVMIMIMIM